MNHKAVVYRNLKNNKGSAIVYAVMVFLLVSIFAATVVSLFGNNLNQAKHQEYSIEAYYLSYSGVQMAFTSLVANENELFDDIKDGTVASLSEDDIAFGNGTVDIVVTKSTDANYMGWIKIVSTGTLDLNNISRTRTLYIDPSNQKNVVWKEF